MNKNIKPKKLIKKIDEESLDLTKDLVNDLSDEEYNISHGELSIDIYETEKEIVIESPVAGVNVEDIDIDIDDEKIKISGTRLNPNSKKKLNYIYRECFYGKFSRSIILPCDIKPEKTKAKIENGILKITLIKK